jgi:hypothetical protein
MDCTTSEASAKLNAIGFSPCAVVFGTMTVRTEQHAVVDLTTYRLKRIPL